MKRMMMVLFLSIISLVLTTKPASASALQDNESTASCTLSFVDVYCAENPEECQKNTALSDTSIHADFAFVYPQTTTFQVQNASFDQSVNSTLFGPDIDENHLFDVVNAYRTSIGLAPFSRHPDLCAIAASRKGELEGEIRSGNIHGGMRSRSLPYFVTENMKWGVSEQEVLSWWLNSPIHASAIHGSTQYACTACQGPVCIMLFTDFVPNGTASVPSVTPSVAVETL